MIQFDDPQVFDDPKELSIGSMDFYNPKFYGDISIFDGLVSCVEGCQDTALCVDFVVVNLQQKSDISIKREDETLQYDTVLMKPTLN